MNFTRCFLSIALSCGLLASTYTVDGAVNAAEQQPIQITFNGEALVTDAAPFIKNSTTFVPFRALFEPLGMTVVWEPETRTITGEGGGVSIVLQVGRATAEVNGETRTLAQAPLIVSGRTFVPLRFVSESAKATVDWNGSKRLVTVVSGSSPAQDEAAVAEAYREYVRVANLEDAAAVERTLHRDSPLRTIVRYALADAFGRRDVETAIASMVVEEVHAGLATLFVTEDHVRTSGAFYLDNRVDLKVTMKKEAGSSWKLHEITTLSQEWLLPFGPGGQAGAADPLDTSAAENTIGAYMEALNQEDLYAALRSVHADSPMRTGTSATLQWLFSNYDLSHELEKIQVLERAGDEMYVYTVQATRKKSGPKLADVRTESIHTLRQQRNGEWKLYSTIQGETETLSIPQ
jgi:hypothetical protein